MSWDVTVSLDNDKANVGRATATWTDPNTDYGTFTHSARVEVSVAGRDAFIADAIAARDAWQTRRQDEIDKAQNVLTNINSTDPKV